MDAKSAFDINRAKQLCAEGRYLAARQLYEDFMNLPSSGLVAADQDFVALLLVRCADIENALNSNKGLDWELGADFNGIKTTYRGERDGSISVSVMGQMDDLSNFDLFCAFSDFERYSSWCPLCTVSKIYKKISLLENILQVSLSTPFMAREFLVKTWAADCLTEHNSFLLFASSVDENSGYDLPRSVYNRAVLNNIFISVKILSPSSIEVKILFNIHMKISLPKWMILFFINNLIGVCPIVMKNQSKVLQDNPEGKAAQSIRDHSTYFLSVALPRARSFYFEQNWTKAVHQLTPLCLELLQKQSVDENSSKLFNSQHTISDKSPHIHIVGASPVTVKKAIDHPDNDLSSTRVFNADKSGFLWKEGWGLFKKPWARRMFRLDVESKKLEYFTENDVKKGEVQLTGVIASIVNSKKSVKFGPDSCSFVVVYPNQQDHKRSRMVFVADTLEEAISWVLLINAVGRSDSVNDNILTGNNGDDLFMDNLALNADEKLESARNQSILEFLTRFIEDNAIAVLFPLCILFLQSWFQPMAFLSLIYYGCFFKSYMYELRLPRFLNADNAINQTLVTILIPLSVFSFQERFQPLAFLILIYYGIAMHYCRLEFVVGSRNLQG